MQIIITQSEIESAIRTYIMEQVSVKPGMAITIDLKATRGAEGATAIIDIVAVNADHSVVVAQEPKKKEAAEVIHDIKPTPAKLFTAPVAPVVVEAPAAIPVSEAIAPLPEVVTESPVHVPDAEVPVPARTSLFAGLRKPVNA